MMRGTGIAAVTIVLMVAAAFLGAGCQMPGSAKVFRNNHSPLVVEKGQQFIIVLESNPTTGYSWKLGEGYDQGIVELEKIEYEPPASDRLGAAGEEKWTFKAAEAGRTTLTFRCIRSWEKEGEEKDEPAEEEAKDVSSHLPAAEEKGGEQAGKEGEAPQELSFTVDVVPKGSSGEKPHRYGESDAGDVLGVALEKEFELALGSNPTTGYSWQLVSYDRNILFLVSQEYEREGKKGGSEEKEAGQEEPLGAGGVEVFTFRAVGEGETEVELRYLRPWETGHPPEKGITFHLEVRREGDKEKEGH